MTITIGFIGLGLIGGSMAKAIRKIHPDYTIVAYNRTKEVALKAKQEGVIDIICEEQDSHFANCDFIFLCTPVEQNIKYLSYLKGIIKRDCILSDVGSVKGIIHKQVNELGLSGSFIGGHPMAGSEKTGYENSNSHLLENAYYILTPGEEVSLPMISSYVELVSSIHAIPLVLTYEEHDYITAGISHLPHLIASTLVNLVKNLDNEEEHMKMIAAGGFKDITRIASSSPTMWEQICMENPENISKVLDEYIRLLIQVRYDVDHHNKGAIYQMFSTSRDYRDSIDILPKGPLKKAYELYCDLEDEAGGIAAIATILAMDGISIKNIGIIHNREFEQGVLHIEFYDQDAMDRGLALLQKRNYMVYQR
jgi:prephenate dehydrogenase